MNWKLKCVASYLLDKLPCSMQAYNLIQKRFTKRWHRDVRHTMAGPNNYTMHLDAFGKHWGDFSKAQYFEFGVARDLFSNLVNYCSGMERQLAVDLNPLATAELVNGSCQQLKEVESPYFTRKPAHELGADFRGDLKRFYGIDYRAPMDARNVSMPDGFVDLIASTSTFEHIPESMLAEILSECHRLCHPGSIMSHEIDYSDHYSHRDKSITPYNFLQFSDKTWDRIHMRHYFQNRLRHNDIRRLILAAGFTILEEKTVIPDNAEAMISRVRLDKQFQSVAKEDILATKGHFVCIK